MTLALAQNRLSATRERIAKAALTLFLERGFAPVTMRDIAVKAGVAVGAAYYYFRSKDDLLLAFGTSELAELGIDASNAVKTHSKLKERLLNFWERTNTRLERKVHLLNGLFQTYFSIERNQDGFSELWQSGLAIYKTLLTGTNEQFQGPLAAKAPQTLWLTHVGWLASWCTDTSQNREESLSQITRTLNCALAALQMNDDAPLSKALSEWTPPPAIRTQHLKIHAKETIGAWSFFDNEPDDRARAGL